MREGKESVDSIFLGRAGGGCLGRLVGIFDGGGCGGGGGWNSTLFFF